MLFLKNNQVASGLYVYYLQNIRNLEASARRMATGKKLASLEDGGGEIGVADLFSQKIAINDALLPGMTTAQGYLTLQGEVLEQADEILDRMSELASDALDTTLTTTDRIALDSEFQSLEAEFTGLISRKFNDLSLFGQNISLRVGKDSTDTITITAITFNLITFTAMTLSQIASASSALKSLTGRLSSLNIFKGRSGAKAGQIQRVIDFTNSVSTNLQNSEDSIRNIDLAIETGNFTQQQVILASSQSVLSQANNLIQSVLQFLT